MFSPLRYAPSFPHTTTPLSHVVLCSPPSLRSFFFFFSSVTAVGEALPSRCVHADLFKDMKNQISYLDWCTCIAMMISLSSPNNGALAFSLPPSLIHCHPPSQFPTHLAQQHINPDLLSLCSVTLSTSRHALAALFYFFFFAIVMRCSIRCSPQQKILSRALRLMPHKRKNPKTSLHSLVHTHYKLACIHTALPFAVICNSLTTPLTTSHFPPSHIPTVHVSYSRPPRKYISLIALCYLSLSESARFFFGFSNYVIQKI